MYIVIIQMLIYSWAVLKNSRKFNTQIDQHTMEESGKMEFGDRGRKIRAFVADVSLVYAVLICGILAREERLVGVIIGIGIVVWIFAIKQKVRHRIDEKDIAVARKNDYILGNLVMFCAVMSIFSGDIFRIGWFVNLILRIIPFICLLTILPVYIVYLANRYIYLWDGIGKRKILDIVVLIGLLAYFLTM